MNGILNESTFVMEYDFKEPDIHETDDLLDDINKDCRNKYFHTFEYRLVNDTKFTNLSKNEKSISQLLIELWNLKLNSML